MHVAHVVCSDAFAGVERYVLNSALALQASGCTVSVIGGAELSMRPPLTEAGIAWMPAHSASDAIRALRRIDGVDVIDTHMTLADFAGATVGFLRRIPVVSTRHFAAKRGRGAAHRALAAALKRRIVAQIAISRFVADNIEGESVVVHTGVTDVANINDQSREPIVLVLQRLEAEKRTATALRAWADAEPAGDWRLVVAGEGSEDLALRSLAQVLGVAGSVDFIGFQADVDALLRRASIVLAPTPREGLGIAVIEAMAYGVPVVAARGGGHLESVGGVEDARLFDDATDAGRLLTALIYDDRARWSYGHALRTRQRAAFGVAAQTEETLGVLRTAIEFGRRRRTVAQERSTGQL